MQADHAHDQDLDQNQDQLFQNEASQKKSIKDFFLWLH